ncbi:MAG TPA: LrgB family protein [Usitatibacteraceae bacterium]
MPTAIPNAPSAAHEVWVYLSSSPLLWLTLTLIAYQGAYALYRRSNFNPLLNPVALSVIVIVATLKLSDTPYQLYFDGAQFVHFLLGPAVVALAIPLYAQFEHLRRDALGIVVALLAGAVTAVVTTIGVAWALGASDTTLRSLVPKSITAPIAMGISEKLGGAPSLTAVLVIATGIIGAVCAKYILNALKISDHAVRGFSVGVAAHGIGTARAFQVSEQAGAFAGLAMGLHGLIAAIGMPLLLLLWPR